jgi:negative regulator of sigma E activity
MTTTHPTSDREALSALFDGELGGDVARFALKRLDHDRDWRAACERWSLVGDVLRAQGQALMPAGFPARVRAATVAQEPAPSMAMAMPRWARWGGVGLAASVAAAALFFARQTAQVDSPVEAPAPMVATMPVPATPAPEPARQAPAAQDLVQLASASGLVAAKAARQGSQRPRDTQRASRATSPARKTAAPGAAQAPETVIAAAPLLQQTAPAAAPFNGDTATRPWPRAVLPQLGGNGALTADFGTASPSFYPFEPRLPPAGEEVRNDSTAQDAATP